MIGRYVARRVLAASAVMLALLSVVLVAVDLVEQSSVLLDKAGWLSLRLTFWVALEQVVTVAPLATFLGVLVAWSALVRSGEWAGAAAAGVSPWRWWWPSGAACIALTVLTGIGGEWVAPRAVLEIARLQTEELGKSGGREGRYFSQRSTWVWREPWLMHLPQVEEGGARIAQVMLVEIERDRVTRALRADAMDFREGRWWLHNPRVQHMHAGSPAELPNPMPMAIDAQPADLVDVTGDPRTMQSADLEQLIERRRHAGLGTLLHELERWRRLAHPLMGVWMLLIAWRFVAFHTQDARKISMARALAVGAGVAIAVLAMVQGFRVLAMGGMLSPVMGVLGPGAVALLFALSSGLVPRRGWRSGSRAQAVAG